MSPNMTDEHLDAVMSALPDDLDEGELCALALTIYSAFVDDTSQIIRQLITAIYCVGETNGMSREDISRGLRRTADMWDARPSGQTKH